MEDSPRIVGYKEEETEEKPPPSPPEYAFLTERPTEASVRHWQERPEGKTEQRAKPRMPLSRILLILCLVTLATSTAFMTYVAYQSLNQNSELQQNLNALRNQLSEQAFTKWLNAANITCEDVYSPNKPQIRLDFVGTEEDGKYGIQQADWNRLNVEITCDIANSERVVLYSQRLQVSSRRSFEITEENLTKEFPVGKYRLTIRTTMGGKATTAASLVKEFDVKKDLAPPIITWLNEGSYVGDKLTVRAEISDAENGRPYYVRIFFCFVLVNQTTRARSTYQSPLEGYQMKEVEPSSKRAPYLYSFSFAETNPPFDLGKATIFFYYIEARDREGNTAYSTPVFYLSPSFGAR